MSKHCYSMFNPCSISVMLYTTAVKFGQKISRLNLHIYNSWAIIIIYENNVMWAVLYYTFLLLQTLLAWQGLERWCASSLQRIPADRNVLKNGQLHEAATVIYRWRTCATSCCLQSSGKSVPRTVWSPEIIAWRDVIIKRARKRARNFFVSHAHLRFLNVFSRFGHWRRAGCLQKRRDERFPDSRRSGSGHLDYSWTPRPRSVLVSHRRRPRRRFLPRHWRPLTAGASNLGDLSRSLSINKSIHG